MASLDSFKTALSTMSRLRVAFGLEDRRHQNLTIGCKYRERGSSTLVDCTDTVPDLIDWTHRRQVQPTRRDIGSEIRMGPSDNLVIPETRSGVLKAQDTPSIQDARDGGDSRPTEIDNPLPPSTPTTRISHCDSKALAAFVATPANGAPRKPSHSLPGTQAVGLQGNRTRVDSQTPSPLTKGQYTHPRIPSNTRIPPSVTITPVFYEQHHRYHERLNGGYVGGYPVTLGQRIKRALRKSHDVSMLHQMSGTPVIAARSSDRVYVYWSNNTVPDLYHKTSPDEAKSDLRRVASAGSMRRRALSSPRPPTKGGQPVGSLGGTTRTGESCKVCSRGSKPEKLKSKRPRRRNRSNTLVGPREQLQGNASTGTWVAAHFKDKAGKSCGENREKECNRGCKSDQEERVGKERRDRETPSLRRLARKIRDRFRGWRK